MLEIETIFPQLEESLLKGNGLVVASPGAGKSTCLPLHLLSLPQFTHGKILMLQPRRIAARNIAIYLSEQLGESLGQTIGYRTRGEKKTSTNTRLEIITEGILTRMLQSDPELSDVSLVIFDEFHERSLHADFSLALCLETQQALREDLRLLVMSATIDTEALIRFMPDTRVLKCDGQRFDVDLRYVPQKSNVQMVEHIHRLVLEYFNDHSKDWLIFLPGSAEIKKPEERLSASLPAHCKVIPLYSSLTKNEQQRAVEPSNEGEQKFVLATNIAETSLTIDGIEVVVDSGLEKRNVFDLGRGLGELSTFKISQASAKQRAGRAGRLMPGTCYRCWPKEQHDRLAKNTPPEILQSDLSELYLEALMWGSTLNQLSLIDKPTKAQESHALTQLDSLGLIKRNIIPSLSKSEQTEAFARQDLLHLEQKREANSHFNVSDIQISDLGRKVHTLGCKINIAVMLIRSQSLGSAHLSMACAMAAILEEKDPLGHSSGSESSLRLQFLLQNKHSRLWTDVRRWHSRLNVTMQEWPVEDLSLVLAFGFIQWIGLYKANGRFILVNGSGAQLHDNDPMRLQFSESASEPQWVSIAEMQLAGKKRENAIVRYAEVIPFDHIKRHFSYLLGEHSSFAWDEEKQKLTAKKHMTLGKITYQTQAEKVSSPTTIQSAWASLIRQRGIEFLPLDHRSIQLLLRAELAAKHMKEQTYEKLSNDNLLNSLEHWLLPYLETVTTKRALEKVPFYSLLSQVLSYADLQTLNKLTPESIQIPVGRNAKIEYHHDMSAVLSVKVQELYGMSSHPCILNGAVKLTIELLSPATRPIQKTQDIVSFWAGSYKAVQKEMKGRYPKHYWPDDPANAQATSSTKKRMGL